MLLLKVISDAAVTRASFGSVTSPELSGASWEARVGTLSDERIFGPSRDFLCACGALCGENNERRVCHRCGVIVGVSAALQRRRWGHIQLPMPIPHPMFPNAQIGVVPVLPLAFRRRVLDAADVDSLYLGVIRSVLTSKNQLRRCVQELYCNETLRQPRCFEGRMLRSVVYLLTGRPRRPPSQVGVLLAALSLELVSQ